MGTTVASMPCSASWRGVVVDGHVAPQRVVGGLAEVGEVRALPGEVVVVQDRGPPEDDRRDDFARSGVERERADVLHDHDVGAVERPRDLVTRRGLRGGHREALHDDVGVPLAGDGRHLVAELAQRPHPLRRLH